MMSHLGDDDDDCSSFDFESSKVTVDGYRVKPDLAPILRAIFSKYGDIAANGSKASVIFKSMLVENVCTIVQKLQTTEFTLLTQTELEAFLGLVQDIESDNVEVRWLHRRLDEIHEAKRLFKESPNVKQAKREKSKAAKIIEKEIGAREVEVSKLQKEIYYLKERLTMARVEERNLDEVLFHTKSLLKRFHCGSMVDSLL